MHLFRQAHDFSPQFDFPTAGVMIGLAGTGVSSPVSGNGDLDTRNNQSPE